MRRRALLLMSLLPAAGWLGLRSPAPRTSLPLSRFVGVEASEPGYAQVLAPRPFEFPLDHGPHLQFRHEWWYFTGNLSDTEGRAYGFQLTFFRFALRPDAPAADSAWATRDALLAQFAVTIPHEDRFITAQRTGRPVLGLAGYATNPPGVWVRNWRMTLRDPAPSWSLRAETDSAGLNLQVTARKPLVAQGLDGYSRKGPEPGNASHYYSGMRLAARGRLAVDGRAHAVRGLAWLDREWGSGALGREVAGWDWFGLQLSDGSDLMIYLLRTVQSGVAPESAGTWRSADGRIVRLAAQDFSLTVMAQWRSPRTRSRYPSRWQLRIPTLALLLDISPLLAQQEWEAPVRYWEGAVRVRGTRAAQGVSGSGYAELTGY